MKSMKELSFRKTPPKCASFMEGGKFGRICVSGLSSIGAGRGKMNAVEIEEAISTLAEQPFNGGEFPFAFLQAFGNKETTIKKLRTGVSNSSDLGGVLQRNHIHIALCAA